MRPGRSIARQLRSGFIVLATLLAAAAAVAGIAAVHQERTVDQLTGQIEPLLRANVEARAAFASTQAEVSVYMVTDQGQFLGLYHQQRGEVTRWLAELRRLGGQEVAANAGTQGRTAAAWFQVADRAIELPRGDPGITKLISAASPATTAFYAANEGLGLSLAARSEQLTSEGQRALESGLVWGGALLLLALALVLMASLRTMRSITGPLQGLTATLRRLAAGENAARAEVAGATEVREAAFSLNALADESARLRREDQEHSRLRAVARDAGNRIREHLKPRHVIREAHIVIEDELDCDMAFVQLVIDGRLGSPESYRRDSPLPPDFLTQFPEDAMYWLTDLYARGASMVIHDLTGPEGEIVPPVIRDPMLRIGIVSHLVTPFGIGSEVLGIIAGERTRPGHPWTGAEIDAFQSIAADVGRGLNHARLYEAENHLVEELKALDRAKSDFLATVSHEFRTPLTSIAGYVELLRDAQVGFVTSEQDKMLETIGRNAVRLRNLIEDLLTLSRMEAGSFTTAIQRVNLADIVSATVMAIRPAAENAGLTVNSADNAGCLSVDGDADQLDRVLMNLLSNAVKFTPRGGHVTVSASGDGRFAVVTIRDTGIGIPDSDKKDLFTRFFRASNAVDRSIPGTGLGLTIVSTIVANHGGEMDLQSQEGHGTTVTVRIPLRAQGRDPSAAPGGPHGGEKPQQQVPPPRGGSLSQA
jgi:signal transduction histidine kinase/CHASE3 domain sensor protein